jgi:hypothetical protein
LIDDERDKNIKMHTGKHFEMLFICPDDGKILDSIAFQVYFFLSCSVTQIQRL